MRSETNRTCDRCQTSIDGPDDREFLFQEFVCIDIEFGYGAIQLDGEKYELDLCLECVKQVLLPHARRVGSIWGD